MQPGSKLIKGQCFMLFCLLALLVSACGGGNSTGQQTTTATTKASDDKQIYISPVGKTDIKTFDPALAYDIPSIHSIDMIFTGLVTLDDKLQVRDQLAASHQLADDGVTWTFKLRDGLKFSDGSPLTSADVVYSIDRALQPSLKSTTAFYYMNLIKDSDKLSDGKIKTIIGDSLLAPDPQTVVIKTNKKAAYFLYALTYPCSYVIQKSMIDKYGAAFPDHLSEGIGGAGPFKVGSYTRGKEIVFVPNSNYYGPKPQLKKVVFPFYAQSDTIYKAYQTNQVHTADVPSPQIDAAKALPNKQYHEVPLLVINYYSMNYLTKPFDNIKIRQAFALAVDKDAIAHSVYKDTVIPTNHIVPKGMPGYNENLTGPAGVKDTKGDRDMAKKLFDEGMKEEGLTLATLPPITMEVTSGGSADQRNEYSALQQMWKNTLGVNIKINDVEFSKYLDDVNATGNNPKGLQMWFADWYGDYPDPQDWLTLLFNKGAEKNDSNYGQNNTPAASQQQAMQKLMEQADANPNDAERLQQYNQVEQALVNDVAWMPMSQPLSTYVLNPCVAGIVDNAQGLTPPDDWGSIYITTAKPCADVSRYQ